MISDNSTAVTITETTLESKPSATIMTNTNQGKLTLLVIVKMNLSN